MSLTEFLLARIAEDERLARLAESARGSEWVYIDAPERDLAWEFDPGRVLAECEAKRRIVALMTDNGRIVWERMAVANRDILCLLALPYTDHPDYDEAWRA